MRSTFRRIMRHPVTLSFVASLLIIITSGVIRISTTDIHGGGAYIETTAMSTVGTPTKGSYLALVYRDVSPSSIGEFVRVAVGFDFDGAPRTPEDYTKYTDLGTTDQSRVAGGTSDIAQAADAGWAAAHWVARLPLETVSSVLNVTALTKDATIARAYGVSVGDRILSINGDPANGRYWQKHVEQGFDISNGVRAYGRNVQLSVATINGIVEFEVPVVVRSGPNSIAPSMQTSIELHGTIGITVEEITLLSSERPDLHIPQRVKGPSAGLIHALVYLDALTDGDLTGGMRIAGTGTITSAGSIGGVGGVRHKAQAAIASGADVLFVPGYNLEELSEFSDKLPVISVTQLADVVRWLCRNGGQSTACYTTWQGGEIVGIPAGYDDLIADLVARGGTLREPSN